jgi:eukaryotic-like serine/threonine-protein kinase
MKLATECLTTDEIDSILIGSLSRDAMERLSDHVGQCSECQAALQLAATSEMEVESLVKGHLASPPSNDSAYWPAINSLKDELSTSKKRTDVGAESTVESTPRAKQKAALDFLQPSDDPAYIGRLDHFEIAKVLGRGGMGIVLEAFDPHLQRSVAIKVLNPEYAKNDTARQRFCREARAAAAISHEHVVPMYQVAKESEGQVAFLVMQMIDGETLENKLESGLPLPAQDVARWGMQIAAGLAAAHSKGMIHRDIKPANVLIERETNRVKLTDFGLAQASADVKLTKTGMVTGTPLYMSPEQATGATTDERSDLFSLGAVLYEMATGRSPFQSPSIVGVMKRVMDETPDAPFKLSASLPRALSDLIMRLIEKKPQHRPASAADVAESLASVVTQFGPVSPLHVPAVAPSDSKIACEIHKAKARRRSIIAWSIGSVVLLAAGAILGTMSANRQTKLATAGQEVVDTRFPSVQLIGNSGTIWSVDFVPGEDQILAAIEDGTVLLWDINTQKVLRKFAAHRGNISSIHYHPSEATFATSGDDGFVKLWDAKSFNLIREWKAGNAVRSIAFAPKGDRIVAGDRDGNIHVYKLDADKELMTRTIPGSVLAVDWSDNGKLIAAGGSDKIVYVMDAETLETRQSFRGHENSIYTVNFAPGSEVLASVGWGKTIHVWNVLTGDEVTTLQGNSGDTWGASFCKSSSYLVTAGHDGRTRIWDVIDRKSIAILGGHESTVHNVALDPDRHRIATCGRDGAIRIWDMTKLAEPKK